MLLSHQFRAGWWSGVTQDFTADQLQKAGFPAEQLKEAGLTAKELARAGCSAADLKQENGFTAADLKEATCVSLQHFPTTVFSLAVALKLRNPQYS